MPKCRIIFVTGTDTGAGKTVLTALGVRYLRAQKRRAVAAKPFCTGARDDARILWEAQDRSIQLNMVNPWFFSRPITPFEAARLAGRRISLDPVLEHLRKLSANAEILLIEGAGGLLSPLGSNFSALEIIEALRAEVIVAAPNRLGVLNQILLTAKVLKSSRAGRFRFLLGPVSARTDPSARYNLHTLKSCAPELDVLRRPFLKELAWSKLPPGCSRWLRPLLA